MQDRSIFIDAGRLPKVEFMLLSFLEEISSNGYLLRRVSSLTRDSTGGLYSRLSAPKSPLSVGVPNPPCAKGKKGFVFGSQIEMHEMFAIQTLQRDPVQKRMQSLTAFGSRHLLCRGNRRRRNPFAEQRPKGIRVRPGFAGSGKSLRPVFHAGEIP